MPFRRRTEIRGVRSWWTLQAECLPTRSAGRIGSRMRGQTQCDRCTGSPRHPAAARRCARTQELQCPSPVAVPSEEQVYMGMRACMIERSEFAANATENRVWRYRARSKKSKEIKDDHSCPCAHPHATMLAEGADLRVCPTALDTASAPLPARTATREGCVCVPCVICGWENRSGCDDARRALRRTHCVKRGADRVPVHSHGMGHLERSRLRVPRVGKRPHSPLVVHSVPVDPRVIARARRAALRAPRSLLSIAC